MVNLKNMKELLRIDYHQLVKVREARAVKMSHKGVRINWEHLGYVLEAKAARHNNTLNISETK